MPPPHSASEFFFGLPSSRGLGFVTQSLYPTTVPGPGVERDIFHVKLVQVFTSVPRKSVLSSCLRPGKHPSVEQAWLRGTRTKTLSHLICAQGHIGPVLESAKLDHLRGQLSIGLPGIRPGCLFWDKGQHSAHSPVTVAGCVLTPSTVRMAGDPRETI